MKIRIRGQSVRLRLGRSEVARLAAGEAVEEHVTFGPAAESHFGCVLRPESAVEAIGHTFAAGLLVVRVPQAQIRRWAEGEEVGFSAELPAGAARPLRVLVEKDFVCIDGEAGEPQDDAFPNPSATC